MKVISRNQACAWFKNFEDLIFVDNELPVKATKITSLKNLYIHGTFSSIPLLVSS